MIFQLPGHCPVCQAKGRKVVYENLLANLKDISIISPDKEYLFCTNPECNVVYFTLGQTICHEQLLRKSAYKSKDPDATICYCFGYTIQEANEQSYQEYRQKKAEGCACKIRNPSAKCCAKLFESFLG